MVQPAVVSKTSAERVYNVPQLRLLIAELSDERPNLAAVSQDLLQDVASISWRSLGFLHGVLDRRLQIIARSRRTMYANCVRRITHGTKYTLRTEAHRSTIADVMLKARSMVLHDMQTLPHCSTVIIYAPEAHLKCRADVRQRRMCFEVTISEDRIAGEQDKVQAWLHVFGKPFMVDPEWESSLRWLYELDAKYIHRNRRGELLPLGESMLPTRFTQMHDMKGTGIYSQIEAIHYASESYDTGAALLFNPALFAYLPHIARLRLQTKFGDAGQLIRFLELLPRTVHSLQIVPSIPPDNAIAPESIESIIQTAYRSTHLLDLKLGMSLPQSLPTRLPLLSDSLTGGDRQPPGRTSHFTFRCQLFTRYSSENPSAPISTIIAWARIWTARLPQDCTTFLASLDEWSSFYGLLEEEDESSMPDVLGDLESAGLRWR